MMVSNNAILQVQGFDLRFFMYLEDVDFRAVSVRGILMLFIVLILQSFIYRKENHITALSSCFTI
ncbi:Uncharacterised protein [Klebsiella variicola]|nr:Uncharacterised protein [Klebsiella variicola]